MIQSLFPRPAKPRPIASSTPPFGLGRTAATLAAFALGASAVGSFASPSVFPTGVTRYDPSKAYNDFVLFTGADKVTRLIDLDGNVVREWNYAGFPSYFIDPALAGGQRGHILVTLSTVDSKGVGAVPGRNNLDISKTIGEVDWDGKTVWQWGGDKAPGGAAQQHHDWRRLPNGNTLILANLLHPVTGFAQPQVLDDVVYEINPKGETVWKWVASDHLEEFGFTPGQLKLVRAAPTADYLHVNNLSVVGPNRWFDAGDKRFDPENLVFDSRNANFIAIIDKRTGKVVWTLGPNFPSSGEFASRGKKPTPRPVDQISGQHDAHIIPAGLPGAGNLLVFDNQGEAGYPRASLNVTGGSRILEIDPVKKEIVWEYTGESSGRRDGPSGRASSAAHGVCRTATPSSTKALTDACSRSRRKAKSCGNMSAPISASSRARDQSLPATGSIALNPFPMNGRRKERRMKKKRWRRRSRLVSHNAGL